MRLHFVLELSLAFACSSMAAAQDFPTHPVRILTSEPGGGSDLIARVIAQNVAGLGNQLIVDNRAGIISVETAARAAPDGYTLLLLGSVIWVQPLLKKDVHWS